MTSTTIPTQETIMRTVSRAMPNRKFVVANVGLHKLAGNGQAYWSVTGELYEPHGTWSGRARFNNDRDSDACGAIHDDILRAFPFLAPLVAIHLAGADGVPMHAVANGRYFLQQGEPEKAAHLWRCSVDDLPAVEDVEAFVDAQRERWQRETEAAYALLMSL